MSPVILPVLTFSPPTQTTTGPHPPPTLCRCFPGPGRNGGLPLTSRFPSEVISPEDPERKTPLYNSPSPSVHGPVGMTAALPGAGVMPLLEKCLGGTDD